jgi:hypothetical protein
MQQHKRLTELQGHLDVVLFQLLHRLHQHGMRQRVVAHLLLLPRDDEGRLRRLVVLFQRHVQAVDVVRVLLKHAANEGDGGRAGGEVRHVTCIVQM